MANNGKNEVKDPGNTSKSQCFLTQSTQKDIVGDKIYLGHQNRGANG
jgi:hypothetical protein